MLPSPPAATDSKAPESPPSLDVASKSASVVRAASTLIDVSPLSTTASIVSKSSQKSDSAKLMRMRSQRLSFIMRSADSARGPIPSLADAQNQNYEDEEAVPSSPALPPPMLRSATKRPILSPPPALSNGDPEGFSIKSNLSAHLLAEYQSTAESEPVVSTPTAIAEESEDVDVSVEGSSTISSELCVCASRAGSSTCSFCSHLPARLPYYLPVLKWLPKYSREQLSGDLAAGFTVGVMMVAQGIAYAPLAGRPTINGLYTAFFPVIIYCLLGTSSSLSLGPEIITSVLIGQTVASICATDPSLDPEAVARTLSFMCGAFVLVGGLFRLGFLESVLAHTVVSGLINAICVDVIIGQAPLMFGFPRDPVTDDSPLSSLIYFFSSIGDTNMTAFTAALLTVLFLLVFIVWKRRQPDSKVAAKFPSILFAVILGTLLSYLLDLESYGVVVLGHVDSGFQRPSDTLPKLSRADIGPVISKASVLALLNFIETFVVAKHYAQQSGETISPNRELVALGFANVVGSLFGAYPASGSLTRSKVNHEAGATTPAAGFFASLIVMFAILFMLPLLVCLPRPVVSAIIVTVTAGIMNFKELALCFRLRLWPDFFLSLGIFTSVCLFGIDQSIILAIVMCFLWLVKSIAVIQPRILILGQLHVSKMREKALQFIAQAKLIEESMQEHDEMTIAEAESLTGDAEQPETDALLSPVGRLNRLDSISEDITVAPVPASISTVHSIAIPPTAPSSLASTISDVKPVLTQRRASLIPSLVALEAALTQPAVTNSLRLAAAVTSPGSHQFDFSSSATSSMPGTNDNVVEYVDIEEFPQAEPVPGMILLKLTGALNFSTIGRIEVLFRRLIQFGSISHHPGDLSNATELPEDDIVLDLSEIPSLDGSAVSSFVDILTSISKRGRRVLVVGAREAVVALLIRIKRFRSLSNGGTIYSTMHDAVTHLQQQQQRRGLTSVPGSVRNSPKVSRRSMH